MKSSVAVGGLNKLEIKSIEKIKPWSINGEKLTISSEFTHLGIDFNMELANPTSPTIDNRLKTARGTTYSLMGSGFHGVNGMKPTVSLHMFEVYVISRILYGLEALNISQTDIKKLEVHLRTVIRQLQSLPTRAANTALYILSGTLPMEARIHRKRLSIIPSLLMNPMFCDLIPRQLAMKGIDSPSWIVQTQKLLREYNLPSLIDLWLEPPDQKNGKI